VFRRSQSNQQIHHQPSSPAFAHPAHPSVSPTDLWISQQTLRISGRGVFIPISRFTENPPVHRAGARPWRPRICRRGHAPIRPNRAKALSYPPRGKRQRLIDDQTLRPANHLPM